MQKVMISFGTRGKPCLYDIYLSTYYLLQCHYLMLTELSYNRGISSSSSYSTSTPNRSLLHSDNSFEIITDDFSMIHNSLSAATSLRSSFVVPLQNVIVQNKELKKLLEECTKKVAAVTKDHEMMSQQLRTEKQKYATLEKETLRLQMEITSLHQVHIPY